MSMQILQDESNRGQRLRRLLLAGGWQTWKRLVGKPVKLRLFNGVSFRAYPDCTCSSATFYSRLPNYRTLSFLRSRMDGTGTLLDVGANVGLVSMLLADKVQNAVLFEPNPVAAERAKENIAINGFPFEVREIALSDETGTISFEDAGGVNTCNRTVINFSSAAPTRIVKRTSFDRFLADHGPFEVPVSTVKIDVEGHEVAVIRGMRHLLVTDRPRMIMFEYLQRTNLAEALKVFASVDYLVMALWPNGTVAPVTLSTPPLQDLFAVPAELSGAEHGFKFTNESTSCALQSAMSVCRRMQ